MERFEQTGKTTQDAIRAAEERVGRRLREEEYVILEEGTRGILGLIGAKPAIIEVIPGTSEHGSEKRIIGDQGGISEWAVEQTEYVLEKMGLPGTAGLHMSEGYYKIDVDMEEDDGGILIGRRGSTLEAFQHILRRIVEKRAGRSVPLVIDVGGYRERKRESSIRRALRIAEEVVRTDRQISLDPMPPGERRAVHLALEKRREISTYSVGDDPDRRIVIEPARRRGSRNEAGRKTEAHEQEEALVSLPIESRKPVRPIERTEDQEGKTRVRRGAALEVVSLPSTMSYGRKRIHRKPRNRPVKPNANGS